jgi:hypothetical protein
VNRRAFVTGLGAVLAAPLGAVAQHKPMRIALLDRGTAQLSGIVEVSNEGYMTTEGRLPCPRRSAGGRPRADVPPSRRSRRSAVLAPPAETVSVSASVKVS